jgi:Ser/Thr protein kinase RdoA (MazF antagonist)
MAEMLLKLHKASRSYRYDTLRCWPGDIVEAGLVYYQENRNLADLHRVELDSLYTQTTERYRQIKSQPILIGIIHGDIKLENVLFEDNVVKAVLDFDDYRESYLIEDLTRTVMHDLDSVDRNAIRSGQIEQFREVFARERSIPGAGVGYLATFLKARFLYDVTVYRRNGLSGLVEDLFADPHVAQVILA